MSVRLMKCVAALLTIIAIGPNASAENIRQSVLANSSDYTYMWWANGLGDRTKAFNIQTNRYAMSFDYGKMQLTHLTPLTDAPTLSKAMTMGNKAVFGKRDITLECTLRSDGRSFRIAPPKRVNTHDCQLIESGRFFQRRYLTNLNWGAGAPKTNSGLEIAAWPDRLLLMLHIAPEANITAGAIEMTLSFKQPEMKLSGGKVFVLSGPNDSGVALITTAPAAVGRAAHGKTCSFRLQTGDWAAGTEKQLGVVLYPTASGLSAMVKTIASEARPTLKITASQTQPTKADLKVTYDRQQGWHYIALRNDQPDRTPAGRNNRIERVALTLTNPENKPRVVRLCFGKKNTIGITGLSAIIRDSRGNPVGLPVQISKNWHTKKPGRYKGPWYRGLTMLTVPARTTLNIEYVSVGAYFGGVPAASHAQLCLVGWGNNQLWEEAAIGSWGESICFEPDQGQRGGSVLDTRPLMVYSMGDNPKRKWGWTHNVGGADFLVYYDPLGVKQRNSRMKTLHRRNCPVLTEATYAGRTGDSNIDLQYTASLYRTDDITRGVYSFRYNVRKPTEFKRMVFFQCGGDDYSYTGEKKFARGSETGLIAEWDTSWGKGAYKTKPAKLTGRIPWVSMHQAVRRKDDQGAWANRGIIIRSWEAKLGGRPASPWAAERGAKVRGRDTSLIDIVPPPGVTKLLPGDYVRAVIEHVAVPQFARDYYGPNKNLRTALEKHADTWRMIHREAIGNDLDVKVTTGKQVRIRPIMVQSIDNRAEFTITGGLGYVPLTISGVTDYKTPRLEVSQGDLWRAAGPHQCDYNAESRTWEITYSVDLDSPGDKRTARRFRFTSGVGAQKKQPSEVREKKVKKTSQKT
jgi:hypothetical protein